MISICIPIYNFDVNELVSQLTKQSKENDTPTEIILIDDASTSSFKTINQVSCEQHRYIQLTENIGRASIRNLFLDYAQYEYLLFLDCDATIDNPNFIHNYTQYILQHQSDIICGGRIYDNKQPEKSHLLRWRYGKFKESQPVQIRQQHPNKSFMTNNFLVKKSLLTAIPFDERLKDYGHEDTLFGYELNKQKIIIEHIDNPIVNGDLELNDVFLENTEKGIGNLVQILIYLDFDKQFIQDIKLLKVFYLLKPFQKLINFCFCSLQPILYKYLKKGNAPLVLFDIYKLGILSKYIK